ncbi:hypothetical protein FH581_020210 [Leptospira weilii]|nr:hypothetical protein [Leptospira weilii]UPY76968.1 hypothetical protein FH581_013585 [Leptospira weilii]UPY76984.1 hypothetical protein FH581_013665 [Leptospira weilii]UPY80417.1 hypothetical protein FH581_020210 [Leptospira weilii]
MTGERQDNLRRTGNLKIRHTATDFQGMLLQNKAATPFLVVKLGSLQVKF